MIYLVTAIRLFKTEGRCSHQVVHNVVPVYIHIYARANQTCFIKLFIYLNAREYYPSVYTQTMIRFHPHTNHDGK